MSVIGAFTLGSFIATNTAALALKAIYTDVEKVEEVKEKLLSEGLYHFTTEDSANKILESGYIRPSNHLSSLGSKKCFFFSGIPDVKDIQENIAELSGNNEWTAIKLDLDEDDIAKYKVRNYDDYSIICKGKCKLDPKKVRKVQLMLDIDEQGKTIIREKNTEEIEAGVKSKVNLEKENSPSLKSATKGLGISYMNLLKRTYSSFARLIKDKLNIKNEKIPKLDMPKEQIVSQNQSMDFSSTLEESLKDNVYNSSEIAENDINSYNNKSKNDIEVEIDSKSFEDYNDRLS